MTMQQRFCITDMDTASWYPDPEKFWTKENPHVRISTVRHNGKSIYTEELWKAYANADNEMTKNIYKRMVNSMYGSRCGISKPYVDPMEIKDVIFNDPATIVFWADGTKTVVKCQEGDEFDPEKGLAMAIAKKVYGNKGSYCNVIKKWVEPYYEKQYEIENNKVEEALDAIAESAQKILNRLCVKAFHYDDPIFETREDAEKFIESLEAVMKNYGFVTVADMYEFAGLGDNISYTANKYGWTSFRNLEVNRVRHGYSVNLPKATRIDFGKSDS